MGEAELLRLPRAAPLAMRLGHDPEERLLIVNCDDLGSSHSANLAIHRALTVGFATSATLMVPCPWAYEAARMTQGLDVGVHLTLTAEYPGYRWRSLTGAASLHDARGFLPATAEEAVSRMVPADVRAECRAQIDQAMSWGVDVTHLDSHMGTVQVDERMFEIYLDLAVEYRLPLRMVGARADERLGFRSRKRAVDRGVIFTDHFIAHWPVDTAAMLGERMGRLAPGVTEIYTHPVDDGPELRAYDPDHPDLRARDALGMCDANLADRLAEAGIGLISYRPLRDLQRT